MSALERILEVTWVKSDFILEKKKKKSKVQSEGRMCWSFLSYFEKITISQIVWQQMIYTEFIVLSKSWDRER